MSRPTDDPQFATNATYTAGPYSGNTNKARPSAGNISCGFTPAAGVPAEWMNYLWNNHGQWISYFNTLAVPLMSDHFTGQSLDTGRWLTATGTVSIVDDSANGGNGTCKIDGSGGGTNQIKTRPLALGAGDFRVRARMRVSGVGASTFAGVFVTDGVNGTGIHVDGSFSTTQWYIWDNGSHFPGTPTLTIDAAYHDVVIERVSGTITFWFDGVQVFTQSHAASVTGSDLRMEANGAGIIWADYCELTTI